VLAAAGCGGGDGSSGTARDRTEAFETTPLREPGESGRESRRACDLIAPARVLPGRRLAPHPNDSTDLSICDWRGGGARVQLIVDTAPRAQLRYYNQLAEQFQFHGPDPARRPRKLRHVGDDNAYGGAGAWWTRSKGQLVAYADERLVRVRIVEARLGDRARRRASVRVARLAFRRLSEPGR
jgi:hypothetical protein